MEQLLDKLAEAERRIEKHKEQETSYFNQRLQEIENQIALTRRSTLHQELHTLNTIGKHNNLIEGALQAGMEEIRLFFNLLPEVEMRRGRLGAYEDSVQMLRKTQTLYSLCYTELASQKLQCNRLVEHLRSQQ